MTEHPIDRRGLLTAGAMLAGATALGTAPAQAAEPVTIVGATGYTPQLFILIVYPK